MDDVETVATIPCLIPRLNILAANEALQFAGIDFPDEFFTLRTLVVHFGLGGEHFLACTFTRTFRFK